MHYTDVSSLRSYGQFVSGDEDDLLAAMIGSASKVIDNHCHRKFAVASETLRSFTRSRLHEDYFDGQTLYFDEDLAEHASLITDSPTVTYLPENIPPYFAICLTEGSWARPKVEVTGYWAYSRTPPDDIQVACLSLAKWLFEMRDTTRRDAVMVTPQGHLLVPQGLPADILLLLDNYVRVGMGT